MLRTIILTGAPESSKLDWSEKSLFSAIETSVAPLGSPPNTTDFTAVWRQIPNAKLQMRPILPKLEIDSRSEDGIDASPATFFSANEHLSQDLAQESAGSDISAEDSRPSQDSTSGIDDEPLSDFYDHSFSIHEAVPSSQISDSSVYTPGTPTYESSEDMFSMTPATPGGIIKTPSQRRLSQAPRPKKLSDLNDVPNGSYLSAIQPQTMTMNLIVGILSISPPRKVITGAQYGRRRQIELVEMMVGDDTKSGFSVSMWLPREMRVNWKDGAQEKPEGARSTLRRNLKALRPRDIVLIQNVALSSYRGKVHGQSLRGDVTKVDLLFRKKVQEDDKTGCYSVQNLRMATGRDQQILKVRKVRDWLVEFVGDASAKERKKGRGSAFHSKDRLLPDDTQ